MKNFLKSIRWLLLITIIIVGLDQISKYFIRLYLPNIGDMWSPWTWLEPYARLLHIKNTGAAFGLFKNANAIFMILAAIVSIVIVYYYPRVPENEKWVRFALILQLSGALGNLIDRIFFGTVTDFISIGNFAIFNIADASITVGVFVLLIAVWIQDRNEKKRAVVVSTQETMDQSGNEH